MTAPNVAPVPVDPAVTAAAPGGPGAGATLPRLRDGYHVILEETGGAQRIVAVTDEDVEIVGAYRPTRLNDYRLYLTKLVADAVGLPQPLKVHVVSREDAMRWVELMAALFVKAVRNG